MATRVLTFTPTPATSNVWLDHINLALASDTGTVTGAVTAVAVTASSVKISGSSGAYIDVNGATSAGYNYDAFNTNLDTHSISFSLFEWSGDSVLQTSFSSGTTFHTTTGSASLWFNSDCVVTLTFTYTPPTTRCIGPTSFSVNVTNPPLGTQVQFTWSGAQSGSSNAITGYKIFYDTASNGAFSTLLATITTMSTQGSYTFTPNHTVGTSRYYKIQVLGTVSGYDSILLTTYVTITIAAPLIPRILYYTTQWGEYEVRVYDSGVWKPCQIYSYYSSAWHECHT